MKTHFVDMSQRPYADEGFDQALCGTWFMNYHDCRAAPLPGQARGFFDTTGDHVDCKTCLRLVAKLPPAAPAGGKFDTPQLLT